MNEAQLTESAQRTRDEILDRLMEGRLDMALTCYVEASGKTYSEAESILERLAQILERPGLDADEEAFLAEFRGSLDPHGQRHEVEPRQPQAHQRDPASPLDISRQEAGLSPDEPEPSTLRIADLPEYLQQWLDPEISLHEPARFFPVGFARPRSAILILLALVFVFWLIFGLSAEPWEQLAIGIGIGLPLFLYAIRLIKPYWRGTRARSSIRRGTWRQGLFLLAEDLLYYDGCCVIHVPRKHASHLRTPELTEKHNRDRYTGSHRNRVLRQDAGPKLDPAVVYCDRNSGAQAIAIAVNSTAWWKHLDSAWDTWKQTGDAPPPLTVGAVVAIVRRWLPVLAYLHGLYGLVLLVAALLAMKFQDHYGYNPLFILGLGALSSALLLFLSVRAAPFAHRMWKAVPRKLVSNRGGGYVGLLCLLTFVGSIAVVMKASAWNYSGSAERLPDVRIADIGSYIGKNVMLGLPDGEILRAAGYGTYQSYEYQSASKRRERGAMHYVARLVSGSDPSVCLYLGATEINGIAWPSVAARHLQTAPYYREPSPYGNSDPDSYRKAIMDLDGPEPSCRPTVVEAVADPDAPAARDLQSFWLILILFNLLPLLMLLVWAWFTFERDWTWDSPTDSSGGPGQ